MKKRAASDSGDEAEVNVLDDDLLDCDFLLDDDDLLVWRDMQFLDHNFVVGLHAFQASITIVHMEKDGRVETKMRVESMLHVTELVQRLQKQGIAAENVVLARVDRQSITPRFSRLQRAVELKDDDEVYVFSPKSWDLSIIGVKILAKDAKLAVVRELLLDVPALCEVSSLRLAAIRAKLCDPNVGSVFAKEDTFGRFLPLADTVRFDDGRVVSFFTEMAWRKVQTLRSQQNYATIWKLHRDTWSAQRRMNTTGERPIHAEEFDDLILAKVRIIMYSLFCHNLIG
jgi:hypothetical protein